LNKAIFIDRDGTLVQEVGYLKMLEDLRFTFRAPEALRIFKELGYLNVVVTNQSAIARGILSPKELKKIHQKMTVLASEEGAVIDEIFVCPHFLEGRVQPYNIDCDCRKPKPGMILEAKRKKDLDLSQCYLVGDKMSDMQMAQNAGVKAVLVLTGYGANTRSVLDLPAEVFPNLHAFAVDLQKRGTITAE
jgi:D-glycero-D-manno-heptose 1,7-bisphosphate phosphatase